MFTQLSGVIETVAGLLVLLRPGIGGMVVAAWLMYIALTLRSRGTYPDVSVRDIVMAITAFPSFVCLK